MSRFFTAIVAILFLPCSAKAGILINPVVSVSSDTTNPLATITISLYAGSDSGTSQNVNSYTVDALLTDITPALTSVTLNSPSVVTGSSWSATNFTTATSAGIITGNAGFRFSGFLSGSNISIPQVVSGNSNFLLGTATLTASRPAIGSGAVSYSLDLATYTFTSDPTVPVGATDNSFGFSIAAQTAGGAAVPEPASALILLGGAAGLGWRRFRARNR